MSAIGLTFPHFPKPRPCRSCISQYAESAHRPSASKPIPQGRSGNSLSAMRQSGPFPESSGQNRAHGLAEFSSRIQEASRTPSAFRFLQCKVPQYYFSSRDSSPLFPNHTKSPNQTFWQQDGIVTEEKLEVAGDYLLDLFFGLELDLGIECASRSEKHKETF